MKKLLLIMTLCFSFNSQATLIEIAFDKDSYTIDETITGQLIVSDMSYLLGGFAGTINFNDTSLSLIDWAFGNGFDDGFGSYSFADSSVDGQLYLEDYADPFADELTITAQQGTSFVLASFSFNALTSGMHSVSLLAGLEVISFDNVDIDMLGQQTASFNITEVPEPATGILLLVSLLFLKRKFS